MLERNVPHVIETRQHHPRYPQRDDVTRGHQHAAGIKVRQDFVLAGRRRVCVAVERRIVFEVGPPKRCVRPECRTEPRIQDVFVPLESM